MKFTIFKKRTTRVGILLSIGWIFLAIFYSENSRSYKSFFDITWKYLNGSEKETLMFVFAPVLFTLTYSLWLNLIRSIYFKIVSWVENGER